MKSLKTKRAKSPKTKRAKSPKTKRAKSPKTKRAKSPKFKLIKIKTIKIKRGGGEINFPEIIESKIFERKKQEYLNRINSSKNEKEKSKLIDSLNILSKNISKYYKLYYTLNEDIKEDEKTIIKSKMDIILKNIAFFDGGITEEKNEVNEYFFELKKRYLNEFINNRKNLKLLNKLLEIDNDIELYNLLKEKMDKSKNKTEKINLKLEINEILSKYNYTPISYLKKAIKKREVI